MSYSPLDLRTKQFKSRVGRYLAKAKKIYQKRSKTVRKNVKSGENEERERERERREM